MSSQPLAALAIQPQQPVNPTTQLGNVLQIKNLLGQQQLQQGQQQLQDQQIQENQLNLQERQAMSSLAPKFVQKDDSGKVTGYDNDGYTNALLQSGVRMQTVNGIKNQYAEMVKNQAAAGSAQIDLQDKKNDQAYQLMEGVRSIASKPNADPQAVQAAYSDALNQAKTFGIDTTKLPPSYPGDTGISQIESSLGVHKQMLADAKEAAETSASNAKAALDNANTFLAQNKADVIKNYQQNPQSLMSLIDSGVPVDKYPALNARTKSNMQLALQNGDIDGAKEYLKQAQEEVGGIEKETNPQVQAQRIQTATAEGKARQLVEGMEKPVYAIDPRSGQQVLMSATDAIRAGAPTMLPVTEKEVRDDTQLINRLADVRQKIAQYEQNISKLGTTVSSKDQSNIAALIGSQSFKAGAFGTEIPLDRLNAALDKENISGLSPDAKKLLVSYYNARESMQGYQRVLSGTGRANEKAMELNLDALPNPGTSDAPYAAESLKQFRQNLNIVEQGLPKIPGIKSPEEIEQQTQQQTSPGGNQGWGAQFGGTPHQ